MRTYHCVLTAVLAVLVHATPVRNVVHIILDDARAEMGAYGAANAVTPVIDALARRSGATVFDNAFAQQTVCAPSRSSFLSGTRPDRSHSYNFINSFRERYPVGTLDTIPGMFLAAGRLALGAGKTFHPAIPPAYDGNASWSHAALPYRNPCWNTADNPKAHFQDGGLPCIPCKVDIEHYLFKKNTSVANEFCETDAYEDTLAIDDLVNQLRTAPPSVLAKGFYAACGLRKPHLPWQAAPEDWAKHPMNLTSLPTHPYPPVGMPPLAFHMTDSNVRPNPYVAPLQQNLTQAARRAYYASMTGMDRKLGALFDALDNLQLTNSTAIVLHSDHGFHLGDHGEWRKMTLFENAAKVPLIIVAPWLPHSSGRRSAALTELVDLLPTIAELAEVPLPTHTGQPIDGMSMVPLLTQATEHLWNKTAAFSQYPREVRDPNQPWNENGIIHSSRSTFTHMGYSVRTRDWRFTLWVGWNGTALAPVWDDVAGKELYDHRNETLFPIDFDSHENVNVANASENADVVTSLTAMLKDMFNSS